MWRIAISVPVWVSFLVLRTVLILIGWIVIPIAAASGAYESYEGKDGAGTPRKQYRFTWKWMYIWGNWEDGIANDTYINFDSMFMKILYWSAYRNPVNNLRAVPYLSVKIDRDKVRWFGRPHREARDYDQKPAKKEWFFAWHGMYSNIFIQFEMFKSIWRFWLGWKILPEDVYGVTGHRKGSAGFASQFKKL